MAARPDKIECRVVPETDGASMGLTFVNELRTCFGVLDMATQLCPVNTSAERMCCGVAAGPVCCAWIVVVDQPR